MPVPPLGANTTDGIFTMGLSQNPGYWVPWNKFEGWIDSRPSHNMLDAGRVVRPGTTEQGGGKITIGTNGRLEINAPLVMFSVGSAVEMTDTSLSRIFMADLNGHHWKTLRGNLFHPSKPN
jgi:hypothetical protein